MDLAEVEDHGQLVYLSAVGQVTRRHDGRDAQLLLQDTKSELVVVNGTGLIQRGHVTEEEITAVSHHSKACYTLGGGGVSMCRRCQRSRLHEVRSEVVDQSAQSQPGPPGLGQIIHFHIGVTCRVLLAPFQQLLETAE